MELRAGETLELPIQLSQAENLQFEISDLTGKLIWTNDLSLEKGNHVLEIPASAMPHAGVYVWQIKAGQKMRTGKIVKI